MRVRPTTIAVVSILSALTSACTAGRLTIEPPAAQPAAVAPVTVSRGRQDVWKSLIPKLSQTFFVINNIDQTSGLINVSYSGDPEQFVDCGRVTSYVKNARGERTYDFPGSRANQHYEVMTSSNLYNVDRTVSLEGRANLILEELSASSTRATVNIRYVLSRTIRVRDVMGKESMSPEAISFNSGGKAAFAPNTDGQATTCQSNGALERQLLALVTP